jgi:hypothetical protein
MLQGFIQKLNLTHIKKIAARKENSKDGKARE